MLTLSLRSQHLKLLSLCQYVQQVPSSGSLLAVMASRRFAAAGAVALHPQASGGASRSGAMRVRHSGMAGIDADGLRAEAAAADDAGRTFRAAAAGTVARAMAPARGSATGRGDRRV